MNVLKTDFNRIFKFKTLLFSILFIIVVSLFCVLLRANNIKLGVSIMGNITGFRSIEDIVSLGMNYQKGLGLVIAIIISIFIGEEFQWKTWKLKILSNASRKQIYSSKVILSITLAVFIFLVFEISVLLFTIFTGQPTVFITPGYFLNIICSACIYAVLGSIICFFSMTLKSKSASLIASICYVLLIDTLISVLSGVIESVPLVKWLVSHSLYSLNLLVSE